MVKYGQPIDLMTIDVSQQLMTTWYQEKKIAQYTVSTAKNGVGEEQDSEKTPRGWHQVVEKYGDNHAINSVFVGRIWTGEIYDSNLKAQFPDRDWILTRILRLSGLEPGKNQGGNVDSFNRYIYIHGTPDDVELGKPGSHGCIRINNSDIIKLYTQVSCGIRVFIS